MPTIGSPGARVLVTGANGYVAMWVVRTLLEQGYNVRAVVRSSEKGKHVKEYFSSYDDQLEIVVVEDMTKDGAFDEVVKGVDAIEHIASPATLFFEDPDTYIKPAVQGTVGILESARKFGDKVKRIIITSSVGAIYSTVTNPPVLFDEKHWNDEAIQMVKDHGKDAPSLIKYSASKTLAEKAAWDYYKEHKREAQWDLVVFHPSLVLGPPLQEQPKTPAELNTSLLIFWNMIANEQPEEALKDSINIIHVRDIAAAHVAALRKEEAAGQRMILNEAVFSWQGLRNLVRSLRPDLYASGVFPPGNPNLGNIIRYEFDGRKAKQVLGLKYATAEEIVKDTLADFESRGWLQKPEKA
ncbi:hypothetical protein CVT26_004344 [Gymnopilus dilepis]|uniref:NAD-dependent epimerase/dehydratase domain-containing protein n=1 Tax=Gymnopilus dilepis TaxID=231916 RepID=A0A409W2A8_9AGAR|nr:hypothetical protein CVT26_004344 [Gymnopilus dilepis]